MKIRIGVPLTGGSLVQAAGALGASILLSANAFRRHGRWAKPQPILDGMDVALDSAGFVAMSLYGGYPWTSEQYLDLVQMFRTPPTWYASMDYCCEPEIATSREIVRQRVVWTATMLARLRRSAASRGLPMPMPVLQGWLPEDYMLSLRLTGRVCGGELPELVGLGSVCRRQVEGPAGVVAIVRALDAALPPHVKLHLFGVKSTALVKLHTEFPGRCESTDSQAWDKRAQIKAREAKVRFTKDVRIREMQRWYSRQKQLLRQVG